MKRIILATALVLVANSAFAQTYQQPTYQQGGANYNQDLAACQSYANQVSPMQDAAVGALGGAATGAALGAISGALFKGVSVGQGAAFGAAAGGVLGLAGGAYTGTQNHNQVLNNCMRGRGYSSYY
jgi:outer membrane lipoprotein SlyB